MDVFSNWRYCVPPERIFYPAELTPESVPYDTFRPQSTDVYHSGGMFDSVGHVVPGIHMVDGGDVHTPALYQPNRLSAFQPVSDQGHRVMGWDLIHMDASVHPGLVYNQGYLPWQNGDGVQYGNDYDDRMRNTIDEPTLMYHSQDAWNHVQQGHDDQRKQDGFSK